MALKRYTIEYGHKGYGEPDVVVGLWSCKAHDYEHALEKFHDADDSGFAAFRIAYTEGKLGRPWEWKWQDLKGGAWEVVT